MGWSCHRADIFRAFSKKMRAKRASLEFSRQKSTVTIFAIFGAKIQSYKSTKYCDFKYLNFRAKNQYLKNDYFWRENSSFFMNETFFGIVARFARNFPILEIPRA